MDRKELKQRAIELRLQGFTYREIQSELGVAVPKGTISGWVSKLTLSESANILLSNKQRHASNGAVNQKLAVAANKRTRNLYFDELRHNNEIYRRQLDHPTQAKIALAMLYLGEGAKSLKHASLVLGNSNPDVIKLYLQLMHKCYSADKVKYRIRIQCRADQDIATLEAYWQKLTGIPKNQFYPTYIDRRTINKPTLKLDYKGVCGVYYMSARAFHDLMITIDILMGR